jgi:hypothetical protein
MTSTLSRAIQESISISYFQDKDNWTRTLLNIKAQCSLEPDMNNYKELKKYMRVMKREIVDKVFEPKRVFGWVENGMDIDDYYRIYGDDY